MLWLRPEVHGFQLSTESTPTLTRGLAECLQSGTALDPAVATHVIDLQTDYSRVWQSLADGNQASGSTCEDFRFES